MPTLAAIDVVSGSNEMMNMITKMSIVSYMKFVQSKKTYRVLVKKKICS